MREVLHEPNMRTITMVEKALLDSKDYPTRTQLWKRLPKKIQYQTYQRVLEYLEAHGQIMYNEHTIVFIGVDSPKLRRLLASAVELG